MNRGKEWWQRAMFVAGLTIFILTLFRSLLAPGAILFTSDDNIGVLVQRSTGLPYGFIGSRWDYPLIGGSVTRVFSWTWVLLCALGVRAFVNWNHALNLGLASIFFLAFLRGRGRSWPACALGILTAWWLGTNLTLTYAGHIGKYGALMYSGVALWLIERSALSPRLWWPLLAGGALGGMFLEQQDVALFIGMFLGAYALYACWRERGWHAGFIIPRLLLMSLVPVLIAGPASWATYKFNREGAPAAEEQTNPQVQWEFATQWSVPPTEMIEFIAPGIMGWRSGEPTGPYWGKTGQSPDWEKTKQGFRNFRLENVYVGVIPMGIALYALLASFRLRRRPNEGRASNAVATHPKQKGRLAAVETGFSTAKNQTSTSNTREFHPLQYGDIWFWACATLLALLLSFGKYFPLYRLFYALPGVSAIRCPNKFLHAFQIGLGILAAYGLDTLLTGKTENSVGIRRLTRGFAIGSGIAGIVLLTAAGFIALGRGVQEQEFAAEGWGPFASVMVGNMIRSLIHGGILAVVMGLCLSVLSFFLAGAKRAASLAAAWLLVVLVAGDALLLAQHYIQAMDEQGTLGGNVVTRFLKQNLGHSRVALLDRSGFYNQWLSLTFPYHNIPTFNLVQAPRLAPEYRRYLEMQNRNPIRLWQISAVRYVIGPAQFWAAAQRNPQLKANFVPVLGFNVAPAQKGFIVTQAARVEDGHHMIFELQGALPRFLLVPRWRVVPDDRVVETMATPEFDPHAEVLV
ncbi:MAG: hypothetical protein ACUVWX_12650, partial [Kiritimatiellia bacterium]